MTKHNYIPTLVAVLAGVLLPTGTALAQITWYVDDDAPGDPGPGDPSISDPLEDGSAEHPFDAIQEGIDAAVDGDTVLVLDGTYAGEGNRDLDFNGRLITVRSENGPDTCTIDCEHAGRGFYFHSEESEASVVDGFTITNGNTVHGGGILCSYNSAPSIRNCTFTGNSADLDGGGMCNQDSSPKVTKCTFRGNSTYRGGGMCNYGSRPAVVNCTFTANSAGAGAGIYIYDHSDLTVANCAFIGNIAEDGGGAVVISSSRPSMINCTFAGNAANTGGALYICCSGNATLTNCTFTANCAGVGGAIANCCNGTLTVINCVLWDNWAPTGREIALLMLNNLGSEAMVSYSNVRGGEGAVYVGQDCTLEWGDGNIDMPPLFADPDGPDDDPNTFGDNDYRLSAGSPCIDAADNEAVPADTLDLDGDGDTEEPIPFDLDGNPRFVEDPDTDDTGNGVPPIVDMGAYEFPFCFGDLDGDDDIDWEDLALLLSNYGTTSGAVYSDGDLDRDGDVDLTDLAGLLAVYGTACQ
jgi:hypothetical protein